MDRQEAWDLLNEYTKTPALIHHALAVEAAMRHYARLSGEDEETWAVVGLLHDFDYERFPEPPQHPAEGAKILRERGCPEEIVECVLSHAAWNQDEYPLDRPMRKTLFAVDELSRRGAAGAEPGRTHHQLRVGAATHRRQARPAEMTCGYFFVALRRAFSRF